MSEHKMGRLVMIDGRMTFVPLEPASIAADVQLQGGKIAVSGGEAMPQAGEASAGASLAPSTGGYQGHPMEISGGTPMEVPNG